MGNIMTTITGHENGEEANPSGDVPATVGAEPILEDTILRQEEEENMEQARDFNGAVRDPFENILESRDSGRIADLLDEDPQLLEKDIHGTPLLCFVASEGLLDLVNVLLQRGANIESLTRDGRTPLHLASKNGDIELTRLLCKEGANLEAVSAQGEKPLWISANCGHEHIARVLIGSGSDPDSLNSKTRTTALFEAVKGDNASLVEFLLEKGAHVGSTEGPRQRTTVNLWDDIENSGFGMGIESNGQANLPLEDPNHPSAALNGSECVASLEADRQLNEAENASHASEADVGVEVLVDGIPVLPEPVGRFQCVPETTPRNTAAGPGFDASVRRMGSADEGGTTIQFTDAMGNQSEIALRSARNWQVRSNSAHC